MGKLNSEAGLQEEKFFTTIRPARHTDKTKSPAEGSNTSGEFYPGITPAGEKNVREIASTEIKDIIEKSEPGSVIILSGNSDYIRTKSTTRVSGNEIKKMFGDKADEFLFIDETYINNLAKEKGAADNIGQTRNFMESAAALAEVLKNIKETIAANPDKKIVITYPLYLKEFSMDTKTAGQQAGKPKWKTGGATETWTPYLTEIMKMSNNDEAEAVKNWIRTNGRIAMPDGQVLEGPTPSQIAKNYKRGFDRLSAAGRRLFPNRPLVLLPTVHSWDMDVYIDYAVHNGTVSVEGFEEVSKGSKQEKSTIIGSYEAPLIQTKGNKQTLTYRGKTYEFKPELL